MMFIGDELFSTPYNVAPFSILNHVDDVRDIARVGMSEIL